MEPNEQHCWNTETAAPDFPTELGSACRGPPNNATAPSVALQLPLVPRFVVELGQILENLTENPRGSNVSTPLGGPTGACQILELT